MLAIFGLFSKSYYIRELLPGFNDTPGVELAVKLSWPVRMPDMNISAIKSIKPEPQIPRFSAPERGRMSRAYANLSAHDRWPLVLPSFPAPLRRLREQARGAGAGDEPVPLPSTTSAFVPTSTSRLTSSERCTCCENPGNEIPAKVRSHIGKKHTQAHRGWRANLRSAACRKGKVLATGM